MIILAYVLAILAWPVVTFAGNILIGIALMPIFNALYVPEQGQRPSFGLADIFQAFTLVCTQALAFLVGKSIFHLLGSEASRWLALPLGIWCLVFAFKGLMGGRLERHVGLSWTIGLVAGWTISTVWLF